MKASDNSKKRASVLVIDGQGGGIGKSLVGALLAKSVDADIVCAGTNAYAASNMSKAGATCAVFGYDAILDAIRRADVITGPIGIVIPHALKGEISAGLAAAIADSNAKKVLVPLNKCNIFVAGAQDKSLTQSIDDAAFEIAAICASLR